MKLKLTALAAAAALLFGTAAYLPQEALRSGAVITAQAIDQSKYDSYYVDLSDLADSLINKYGSVNQLSIKAAADYVAKNFSCASNNNNSYRDVYAGAMGNPRACQDILYQLLMDMGADVWDAEYLTDSGAKLSPTTMVNVSGTYYMADVSAIGTKPRTAAVKKLSSLFTYTGTDELAITGYLGRTGPSTLTFPSTIGGKKVTSIASDFYMRPSFAAKVKTVIISEGIVTLEKEAFTTNFSSVTVMQLPSTLKNIGRNAFMDCSALKNFLVSTSSPYLTGSGDILYNKNKTTLIAAPGATSVKIPSTVTLIADSAFERNYSLTSVVIPSSVKEIGYAAFYYCQGLKSLEIQGSSLQKIGAYAMSGVGTVKELFVPSSVTKIDMLGIAGPTIVCYPGTEAEAYAIRNSFEYRLLEEPVKTASLTGKLWSDSAKKTALKGATVALSASAGDASKGKYIVSAQASGSFTLTAQPGKYVLSVSAPGYVTNTYNVTVTETGGKKDAAIYKRGDIDGSGAIDAADLGLMVANVKGTRLLTGYALKVADYDGKKGADINDLGVLIAIVKGTRKG